MEAERPEPIESVDNRQFDELHSQELNEKIKMNEKWKPKLYDYYYYIYIQDNKLQITGISYEDEFFDKQLIESGNCYKTIQEAGKALELIKKEIQK